MALLTYSRKTAEYTHQQSNQSKNKTSGPETLTVNETQIVSVCDMNNVDTNLINLVIRNYTSSANAKKSVFVALGFLILRWLFAPKVLLFMSQRHNMAI